MVQATAAAIILSHGALAGAQEVTAYSYDALGRLSTVRRSGGPANGMATTYAYDPASNRTNVTVTNSPNGGSSDIDAGAAIGSSGSGSGGSSTQSTLSIGNATANEGSPLIFVVTRSGSTATSATVAFATSNTTAVGGTNYTATSGTLSLPAGASSAAISVPTQVDHVYTTNLTIGLTLSSPSSGVTLGASSAVGTIINTDAQAAIVATNPTLPTYAQNSSNTVAIAALATLNGHTARITSFVTDSGFTATIASDGQSVIFVTPVYGYCKTGSNIEAHTVNYVITDSVSGLAYSGVATINVRGVATNQPCSATTTDN